MGKAMLRLLIDDKAVEVEEGSTLLQAARKLSLEIPTLCFLEGYRPSSSCMLCVVEDLESGKTLPACSSLALDGMRIQTKSPGLDRLRKEALELLLSDHRGDCRAPCVRACPAHLDIPEMLRRLAENDPAGAVEICLDRIPLPATLGVVCPAPCEKACRRAGHDGALAIRRLKHFVGQVRLQQDQRSEPGFPRSGAFRGTGLPEESRAAILHGGIEMQGKKRVAVVGAGPAGLSASYYLTRRGFQCILYEREDAAGGGLLAAVNVRETLEAEIALILNLGVELKTGVVLGRELALGQLAQDFDAVVLATGNPDKKIQSLLSSCGIGGHGPGHAGAPHEPFPAGAPVFACGGLLEPGRMAVRAVARGRAAAKGVLRYFDGLSGKGDGLSGKGSELSGKGDGLSGKGSELSGNRPAAAADDDETFDFPFGRLQPGDMEEFLRGVSQAPPDVSAQGAAPLSPREAAKEAARCLHCDCGASETCLLRKYAGEYGASPRRYPQGKRREFRRIIQHPNLVYEPGKCIQCGRCIWIAEKAGERLGLAFQKRGFDVRVGVPFGEALSAGLEKTAAACAEACPTGALVWKRGSRRRNPPDKRRGFDDRT